MIFYLVFYSISDMNIKMISYQTSPIVPDPGICDIRSGTTRLAWSGFFELFSILSNYFSFLFVVGLFVWHPIDMAHHLHKILCANYFEHNFVPHVLKFVLIYRYKLEYTRHKSNRKLLFTKNFVQIMAVSIRYLWLGIHIPISCRNRYVQSHCKYFAQNMI